ncbi:MAG: tRNA uracil 4-sulfurtransferase ThiI [Tissierellia bacterium]|nr:tRNA uracil 4-sulfurtransferase ThiI [Tissierellia bacterium]
MKWLLGISFGELMLKGNNRHQFIKKSVRQVRKALENFEIGEHFLDQGKLFIEVKYDDFDEVIDNSKMIFGLSYVYKTLMVEKNFEDIEKGLVEFVKDANITEFTTFKIKGHRADKSFPLNSMELAAKCGGYILKNFRNFKVSVSNPQKTIYVDIREKAYIYMDRIKTIGGLPLGTGGRALLLLSGGIDSPVAGFEIAKRGVEIGALHFHSYPFTSERALDKVKRLAEKLSMYIGDINFYSVNLLNIYTEINKNCKPRFTTIIARRFMMRIGEIIANRYRYDGFVTGEALGQVASQTIQSISVVNDATKLPILRPLINMDKTEIIETANWIDTYDISIEPYDDCCSFFAPDRPATKPRLYDIEREEKKLDIEFLVNEAIEKMEIIKIGFENI